MIKFGISFHACNYIHGMGWGVRLVGMSREEEEEEKYRVEGRG